MTNSNDPLRKEIIGHIEAIGELACWIVPYLYHAAYQTVKELERTGTLVIEVGKRGEPVYVFAKAASAAQAAPKRVKLTASNSVILRNIKKMFNAKIYKAASIRANSEGEQAAIEMVLKHYVREDRHEAVSAALRSEAK